jgi:hypothetical protein
MRTTLTSLGLVCLAALLAACGQNSGSNAMKGETVEKVQSPAGNVAATSTRETGDEKNPVRYRVYIQKSQDPAQAVEVLDVARAAAPVLRWVGPNGLMLGVVCGDIERFANHADVSSNSDRDKTEQVIVLLENRGVCPANGAAAVPAENTAAN